MLVESVLHLGRSSFVDSLSKYNLAAVAGLSHPHPPLHLGADLPFLLIKGVGVDVQRSGHLGVPQQPGNRSHIRPAGDHQTGCCVSKAVDVQVQGQVVLFEDQLEPPSKGAGGHGQIFSMAAEDVVLYGQFSALVEFQFPLAERTVLLQQAAGKSRHTGPRRRFWVLSQGCPLP